MDIVQKSNSNCYHFVVYKIYKLHTAVNKRKVVSHRIRYVWNYDLMISKSNIIVPILQCTACDATYYIRILLQNNEIFP
jgi:hypothetical protein